MVINKDFISSSRRKYFKAKYLGFDEEIFTKNKIYVCSVWTFDANPKLDSNTISRDVDQDEFNITLKIENSHIVFEIENENPNNYFPQITYPRMEDVLEEWEIVSNYQPIFPKKDLFV